MKTERKLLSLEMNLGIKGGITIKQYQDLNKLLNDLQMTVAQSLKSDVAKDLKKVMKEEIDKEVYQKYEPKVYIRDMDDGGLTDDKNIKTVMIDKNTLMIESARYDGSTNVSRIVQTGEGYTINFPYYGVPRNFTETTHDRLKSSNEHVDVLKKSLQSKGINVK